MSRNPPLHTDEVFRALKRDPKNQYCFDCGCIYPGWASVYFGIFICKNCAGTHRNMGVHISPSMDSWTQKQLLSMQLGGNAACERAFASNKWFDVQPVAKRYAAAQPYRQELAELVDCYELEEALSPEVKTNLTSEARSGKSFAEIIEKLKSPKLEAPQPPQVSQPQHVERPQAHNAWPQTQPAPPPVQYPPPAQSTAVAQQPDRSQPAPRSFAEMMEEFKKPSPINPPPTPIIISTPTPTMAPTPPGGNLVAPRLSNPGPSTGLSPAQPQNSGGVALLQRLSGGPTAARRISGPPNPAPAPTVQPEPQPTTQSLEEMLKRLAKPTLAVQSTQGSTLQTSPSPAPKQETALPPQATLPSSTSTQLPQPRVPTQLPTQAQPQSRPNSIYPKQPIDPTYTTRFNALSQALNQGSAPLSTPTFISANRNGAEGDVLFSWQLKLEAKKRAFSSVFKHIEFDFWTYCTIITVCKDWYHALDRRLSQAYHDFFQWRPGYVTPELLGTNYMTMYFQHKNTLESLRANDAARPVVVYRAEEFRWICKFGFTHIVEEIIMEQFVHHRPAVLLLGILISVKTGNLSQLTFLLRETSQRYVQWELAQWIGTTPLLHQITAYISDCDNKHSRVSTQPNCTFANQTLIADHLLSSVYTVEALAYRSPVDRKNLHAVPTSLATLWEIEDVLALDGLNAMDAAMAHDTNLQIIQFILGHHGFVRPETIFRGIQMGAPTAVLQELLRHCPNVDLQVCFDMASAVGASSTLHLFGDMLCGPGVGLAQF